MFPKEFFEALSNEANGRSGGFMGLGEALAKAAQDAQRQANAIKGAPSDEEAVQYLAKNYPGQLASLAIQIGSDCDCEDLFKADAHQVVENGDSDSIFYYSMVMKARRFLSDTGAWMALYEQVTEWELDF